MLELKTLKNIIDVSNHSLLRLVILVELSVAPRMSESLANLSNMLNPFSSNVSLLYHGRFWVNSSKTHKKIGKGKLDNFM